MKLLLFTCCFVLLLIACVNDSPRQVNALSKKAFDSQLPKSICIPSINNSILGQWFVKDHIYLLNANLNADELIRERGNLNLCLNSSVVIDSNGIGPDNTACELSVYNFKTNKCTARKLPVHEGSSYTRRYMGSEVADSNYISVQLAWLIKHGYAGRTMTVLNTNCHFENTNQVVWICIADSNTIGLLTYADLLVLERNKPKQILQPDTSLSKTICLQNYKIIEATFGDLMPYIDKDKDLPEVYLSNKTETQFVKLIFHPGSVKNSFDEFEVSTKRPARFRKTNIETFVTENGIQLGMSLSKFLRIKKNNFTTVAHSGTVMAYTLRIESPNIFLRGYNMPVYYCKYFFDNERLTNFSFGFEYP
ncbi:MAG: hypothetical protein M0D57_10845 [Sphingobacteriales bacterium JAD_PAG50586_3]|nr:MAG: hypothetical protein M0D57_10845 [Sphingobacteriales bacterium JAD_PAG50586_3]